ncbi:hypothetical protein ACFL1H_00520 [Nanoarchaeota archaeon]
MKKIILGIFTVTILIVLALSLMLASGCGKDSSGKSKLDLNLFGDKSPKCSDLNIDINSVHIRDGVEISFDASSLMDGYVIELQSNLGAVQTIDSEDVYITRKDGNSYNILLDNINWEFGQDPNQIDSSNVRPSKAGPDENFLRYVKIMPKLGNSLCDGAEISYYNVEWEY